MDASPAYLCLSFPFCEMGIIIVLVIELLEGFKKGLIWFWKGHSMESSMEVPQKIKNRTILWFSNSGYLSEENEIIALKRYLHPHVRYSIIYNSQDMEANKMSINRQMDKEVAHIPNRILASEKNEQCHFHDYRCA